MTDLLRGFLIGAGSALAMYIFAVAAFMWRGR